ncbi:hypothetical protein [Levilactobacillus sp. N40-8-2]|uniref:hypothetical protein n=1 Tax=Levilactobacillus muriae TaxID=3238987 RepID=UPI0038B3EFFB
MNPICRDYQRVARDYEKLYHELEKRVNRIVKHDVKKQPHIRIDFDAVSEVPKVYVDGVDVTDVSTGGGLVALHLDWITNTEQENRKHFLLTTLNRKTHEYETIGNDSGEGAADYVTKD